MINYALYDFSTLRNGLIKLKANVHPNDFPVIEQIEKELRRRGYDPTNVEQFGPDVIGDVIKKMIV